MCPSPHLWFSALKNRDFMTQNYKSVLVPDHTCGFVHAKHRLYDQNYMSVCVPDLTGGFCACKTACLPSELIVSLGPCPHLWLLDAKQRL